MGFGRFHADATVVFTYVCSLDTALPASTVPECADFPPPAPPAATVAEQAPEGGELPDAEAVAKSAKAAHLAAYLADFYATPAGGSVDAEERGFLATLSEPTALTLFCQRRAKRWAHREYCRTGDESLIGPLGADVIRFRLNPLTAPDRATAIGFARETADGLTDYARKYRIARFVLERTLIGADGWPEFRADKQTKRIDARTFDVFDPEWVIEIGYFVLDLPSFTEREKKA